MILVTGATGTVGSELVQQLVAQGEAVRVLTRDERKVEHLRGQVDTAVGDLFDAGSLEKALAGIERMFLLDFETGQVESTLAAAQRSGLRHIVKLSTIEAGHEPMIGHGVHHRQREDLIRASGLEWTFLRPTMFMSNALDWAETIRTQGTFYYPGGEGRVPAVDPWDVASVAAAALTQPGHAGQAYTLTGPKALSFGEMAAVLSQVLDRPVRYIDIPEEAAAEHFRQGGLPEYVIAGLVEAFSGLRAGRFSYLTDMIEQVTGCPPRTFAEWAARHRTAFL